MAANANEVPLEQQNAGSSLNINHLRQHPHLENFHSPLPICTITNSPEAAAVENSKLIPSGRLLHYFHDWVSSGNFGCTFFEHGGIVIKPVDAFKTALETTDSQGRVLPLRMGKDFKTFTTKLKNWGFNRYEEYKEENAAVYHHPDFTPGDRECCGLIMVQVYAKNHGMDPSEVTEDMGALRRAPKQPSTVIDPRRRRQITAPVSASTSTRPSQVFRTPSPSPSPQTPVSLGTLLKRYQAKLESTRGKCNSVEVKAKRCVQDIEKLEKSIEVIAAENKFLKKTVENNAKLFQRIFEHPSLQEVLVKERAADDDDADHQSD